MRVSLWCDNRKREKIEAKNNFQLGQLLHHKPGKSFHFTKFRSKKSSRLTKINIWIQKVTEGLNILHTKKAVLSIDLGLIAFSTISATLKAIDHQHIIFLSKLSEVPFTLTSKKIDTAVFYQVLIKSLSSFSVSMRIYFCLYG